MSYLSVQKNGSRGTSPITVRGNIAEDQNRPRPPRISERWVLMGVKEPSCGNERPYLARCERAKRKRKGSMQVKGRHHKSEGPTEVERPQRLRVISMVAVKKCFTRSARELIPCSPTSKMMAPALNIAQ